MTAKYTHCFSAPEILGEERFPDATDDGCRVKVVTGIRSFSFCFLYSDKAALCRWMQVWISGRLIHVVPGVPPVVRMPGAPFRFEDHDKSEHHNDDRPEVSS